MVNLCSGISRHIGHSKSKARSSASADSQKSSRTLKTIHPCNLLQCKWTSLKGHPEVCLMIKFMLYGIRPWISRQSVNCRHILGEKYTICDSQLKSHQPSSQYLWGPSTHSPVQLRWLLPLLPQWLELIPPWGVICTSFPSPQPSDLTEWVWFFYIFKHSWWHLHTN